jgi:two-component system response regulator AtoC
MMVSKNGITILLGEDDVEVRTYLETALKYQGYTVESAPDGEEVLACLQATPAISAVVLDMGMPRRDGLDTLKEIRRCSPNLPVIMMSGSASPLNAVQAMKNGASDFIMKPVQPEDLRKSLKQALDIRAAAKPPEAPGLYKREMLFGNSPQMREMQRFIGQISWSDAPVLVQGETGAGKEVLARELHARSRRAKKPFLKLNCAALPSELVESELFGYERGAFTGAFQKKLGMFELADGGTILLDEIGDMDVRLQAKLLQVLQDQCFQRLGGKETITVDVRIIAATHRDLPQAIAANLFREDLYYRLNVVSLRVPPLRERREDILPLAEMLLRKHSPAGAPLPVIPASTAHIFLKCSWPGNIRQLENVIRNFLILRDERLIERYLCPTTESRASTPAPPDVAEPERRAIDLGPTSRGDAASDVDDSIPDLKRVANANLDAERVAITAALKRTNWNRRHAAVLLKIDYKGLLYKMKKLSIKKDKTGPYIVKRGLDPSFRAPGSAEEPSREVAVRGAGVF